MAKMEQTHQAKQEMRQEEYNLLEGLKEVMIKLETIRELQKQEVENVKYLSEMKNFE